MRDLVVVMIANVANRAVCPLRYSCIIKEIKHSFGDNHFLICLQTCIQESSVYNG